MIPKIAHFIWFGTAPEWVLKVVAEFKALHADWDVRLWTSIPRDMPDGIRRRLLPCDQICQWADIFAVWLLYKYGGVYLDTDAIAIRSFDPLLKLPGVTAFTSPHNNGDARLTNGLMGSAPKSAAFARCMRYIEESDPPMRGPALQRRCYYGPDMLTELFKTLKEPGMTVLPWHYFYPYTYDERQQAAQCWRSDPATRVALVDELRTRFSDGVAPFAIHLWGVDGSSHRGAANVTEHFEPEPVGAAAADAAIESGDPAGKAPDRSVAPAPAAEPVPGPAAGRSRDRGEARRAGKPASR